MSHLNFWILAFSTNFCPIKTDLSGNIVWPQASGFQKLAKMDIFWHFWLTYVHSKCWMRLFGRFSKTVFPMEFRFPLADEFTLQHGGFSAWLCQALLWSHNGYRVRRTVIAASPDMKFFSWTDATEDLGRLWIFPWKPRVLPGIIAKSLRNA